MGQTLLTLASIVLLSVIAIQIGQMYTSSVSSTVETQLTADAINFARDVAEDVHSYAFRYNDLDNAFGNFTDVNNPATRIEFTPQVGITFYATVELGQEENLRHNVPGRMATIRVYEEERPNQFRMIATNKVSVFDLNSN
jgi:uncharacterized protein (UPF0333 family)